MLDQIEGSQAVARAIAKCRPEVIAAYPISPQTHIVEGLSDLVRMGELTDCEYMMVESEFGALSACIGAPQRRGPAPTPRPRARACCSWRRHSSTPRASGCRS
jgi:pyruvate/2-oxoacid:ferredoxin oxidoreductase alpha subunit